ncbi:FAS1 domain-containing protein [Bisporella sp. PMI_857]|nr:FAS1 domain-containing protein [Bisporella sp. PMI_857]
MHLPTSLTLLAVSFTASVQAVTLFEGLIAANASRFAEFIQTDLSLVAIFTSPDVKTVFAPTDDAVEGFNETDFRRSLHLFARQGTNRNGRQQCSDEVTDVAAQQAPGGTVVQSNLPADGGRGSPIVAKAIAAPPPGNATTKRQVSGGQVRLFSGLGNNVTLVKGDTPYDSGLIQTVDGFFTAPLSLSATLAAKGLTAFASALNSTNLTSTVAAPLQAGVTVFVPSDAAFAAAGGSANVNLASHIVPNFLGVTPNLKDGVVLTTQAGTKLTVRVRGEEIFLGEARIQANDLITSNGAIQVIDKVITPVVPFTGAAAAGKSHSIVVTTLSVLVSLGFARFMI